MSTNNTNIQNGIIEEDKRRAEAEYVFTQYHNII